MKVRLDFCDFWPGFLKTRNFFYDLLSERFDIQLCDQPDFLIYSDPGQHVHRVHNCAKIHVCVESFAPDFTTCDYSFTCRETNDARNLRMPYYVLTTGPQVLRKTDEEMAGHFVARTKFCSFVVSNAKRAKTQKRIQFFQRLSKYKMVDSGGAAFNNIGGRLPVGEKLNFLRSYKFNIAFENSSVEGYTTEKLTEAMAARCLPIYWGNPQVGDEFNTKSFLNYFDFPNEEALIEKIIELDKDDAKYMEYMRQPFFHNNTPNKYFGRERLLDQFEKIFSTTITPVSSRRYWNQIGRWIVVKKNRTKWA